MRVTAASYGPLVNLMIITNNNECWPLIFKVMNNIIQRTLRLLVATALFACFAAQAQFWKKQAQTLLPDHEAFIETAYVEGNEIKVAWQIADDYYMYRDQFNAIPISPGLEFGDVSFPPGVVENDPEFGDVVVYFNRVEYSLPIKKLAANVKTGDAEIEFELKAQGCNKPVGVCYAPQTRPVKLVVDPSLFSSSEPSVDPDNAKPIPSITEKAKAKSFWSYVFAALGAGVLLSFTPCVLPMIPILAGIIAGQNKPSKLQSGWLATCYVLGTIVTYAIAGWVAGASGTQLQAHFQNPWVIGIICLFLVVLATSLFGAFKIQLPSSIQTKLNTTSVNSKSASISSFGLGLISALVVGACVSPILIITLGAAIQQGDPVLGSAIMSAMALGMGSLLILFGFGAGWLLPRTGAWMNNIQVLFGFMVLGVAIFIASAINQVPTLYLWAVLLLWSGSYLLKFASQLTIDLLSSLIKAGGLGALLWGAMALIGATSGGNDILNPLTTLNMSNGQLNIKNDKLPFKIVTNAQQAKEELAAASSLNKPVLVDFYADWCLDCKRMDRTTYLKPSVADALQRWSLIKIDVTKTNKDSEDVKRYFEVFGPPATLFYKGNGQEEQNLRQYGYLNETDFLSLVNQASD